MKTTRLALVALLVSVLAASLLASCSACARPATSETAEAFSYSRGIDANGFWEGIRALDYVSLFDYEELPLSREVYEVSDEALAEQVDTLLANYASTEEVTGRPATDGDTLNIDFVGTIDGVAFEGGSTEDAGTDVVIGETAYIDDFIEQLKGHNTGDSFSIEVTFPEDYSNAELSGRDAEFAIRINRISQTTLPELTDAFVAETLEDDHGWTTVDEMTEALTEDLKEEAIDTYVQEYLVNEVSLSEIPEALLAYQEEATIASYESYAAEYDMNLDEFLAEYLGMTSTETLLENSQTEIRNGAVYSLVVQAIAEDAGITVSEEDVAAHFLATTGSADYTSYQEQYGLPYLMQNVLGQKVLDLIIAGAVYEPS